MYQQSMQEALKLWTAVYS